MATFYTNQSRDFGPRVGQGHSRVVISRQAKIACTTAMVAVSQIVNVCWMPKGAVLLAARIASDDMDSNGTPTLAWHLGDSGSASRIFSASTVSQAGTLSLAFQPAALGYKWTADTLLFLTASTGAATAVAGNITVVLEYFVDVDFDTAALVATTTA